MEQNVATGSMDSQVKLSHAFEASTSPGNAVMSPTNNAFVSDSGANVVTTLSKSAQKKLLKQQRKEEMKLERRAREKAAKAEKKRLRREESQLSRREAADSRQQSSPLHEDTREGTVIGKKRSHHNTHQNQERYAKKPRLGGMPFNARVVVDLGFDDMMLDKEIKSLTSQCAYCYSANRKSANPFLEVLFTSLNKRTLARFESIGTYKQWKDVEFWSEDYDQLWAVPVVSSASQTSTSQEGGPKNDTGEDKEVPSRRPLRRCEKESVVYLTADTDQELVELKEGETYIIGGICDHNRYKNLCRDKANSQSIRAARLPIGKYFADLPSRKVLTVNQVLEILLKWVETRDWEKAIWQVMPKRKLKESSSKSEGGKADEPGGQANDHLEEEIIEKELTTEPIELLEAGATV